MNNTIKMNGEVKMKMVTANVPVNIQTNMNGKKSILANTNMNQKTLMDMNVKINMGMQMKVSVNLNLYLNVSLTIHAKKKAKVKLNRAVQMGLRRCRPTG